MPQTASPFAPLRHRAFRSLWVATLFSNLGNLVQAVGAAWMMTSLTSSETMVSLVQASTTLPVMLLALLAGAAADNYERRHVMLLAQIFMCAVSAILAVVGWLDLLTPWLLLTFTFLIGCGGAVHNPAWQSSLLDLVPKADLPGAVTINSMGFNAMRSVGPAIGGIIVAAFGAAMAFTLNAVSYLSVIHALFRWKAPTVDRTLPRESLGAAMGAGLRYVGRSPNILRVLARATVFGFCAITILALLPVITRDLLGGDAVTYGILLGGYGMGAILGAFFNDRLRQRFHNEVLVRGSFLAFAIGATVLGLSPWAALSFVALLLTGGAWVVALSLFNVSVQLSAPRWVVGRALALYQSCTFGGMAAGSWVWGWISEVHGTSAAMVASGLALLLGAALGLIWRLSEFSSLNLDPLDGFRPPALALDIRGRSGPILVMVHYRIAQEDVPAFLALMQRRRVVRLRDGARQWSLLRDLADPELWSESYHTPTWHEYLRHQHRRTQADAEIVVALRALHHGDSPPRVERMIERQTVPRRDDTPMTVQHDKIAGGS